MEDLDAATGLSDIAQSPLDPDAESSAAAATAAPPPSEFDGKTPAELRDLLRTFRRDAAIAGKLNDLLSFYVAQHLKPGEFSALRASLSSGAPAASGALLTATLSPAQMADIAVAAEADARREAAVAKAAAVEALTTLQAVAAQAGLRLQAVRQTAHDFKQTVIRGGVNPHTGKVTAEAVVRFFEESLRKRRSTLEKIEAKTATVNSVLATVKTQDGRSAATSSDLLKYIVFHQLKIEITQSRATLLEKSRELLRLKLGWSITSNLLAQLKQDMSSSISAVETVRATLSGRQQSAVRLAETQASLTESLADAKAELERNRQRAQDACTMPTTLDYMALVRTQELLQRQLVQVQRKTELQEMLAASRGRGAGAPGGTHRIAASPLRTSAAVGAGEEGVGFGEFTRVGAGAGAGADPHGAAAGQQQQFSTTVAGISGTRPLGTTASIARAVYSQVGTGAAAPAPSALRRTMPAKAATETAETLSGRALGGGFAPAPLLRNLTGGGPPPRGVAGFPGGLVGGSTGGAPVVSRLHLGSAHRK